MRLSFQVLLSRCLGQWSDAFLGLEHSHECRTVRNTPTTYRVKPSLGLVTTPGCGYDAFRPMAMSTHPVLPCGCPLAPFWYSKAVRKRCCLDAGKLALVRASKAAHSGVEALAPPPKRRISIECFGGREGIRTPGLLVANAFFATQNKSIVA